MYRLRPPRVIDLRPQTRFVSVNLAYSRRGRARWFLRPPILRVAQVFRPVEVTLVRLDLRRRRPVTELRAPTRVFPFLARKTEVTLAYQTRGRPRSVLAPPAVIRERENQPLRVTLARITKPPTVALLRPPVVVHQQPVVSTLAVHLAYSVRGKARYGLAAPAVVAPHPLARAVQVTLARIRPPKRFWRLLPPAVVQTFIPPAGEVCGYDIAASFDCGDDSTLVEVCGTDLAAATVEGSDQPESRINGDSSTVGDVCGDDLKAT
jgi:hypothetical protein